jgi:hypothetical protein
VKIPVLNDGKVELVHGDTPRRMIVIPWIPGKPLEETTAWKATTNTVLLRPTVHTLLRVTPSVHFISVQNTIRRVTYPKSVHFVPKCSF